MALVYVHCPECQSIDVVQVGKQANGTQRYRCHNRDCRRTIVLLQYSDTGRWPAVKQQIVDMTLNGSGVRDIVRVLGVSSATVIDVLKKKEPAVKQVNERLLHTLDPLHVDVILRQVEKAEMDEMWSFVGWIRSLKRFCRRPAGAVHCTAERGTARLELVQGAAGVSWGGREERWTRECNTPQGRDTCAARTLPPRPPSQCGLSRT
jgi:transposase-like protein